MVDILSKFPSAMVDDLGNRILCDKSDEWIDIIFDEIPFTKFKSNRHFNGIDNLPDLQVQQIYHDQHLTSAFECTNEMINV